MIFVYLEIYQIQQNIINKITDISHSFTLDNCSLSCSSLPEVETRQQGVTVPSNPSILLQPSSETFSQSFSLYFLLTLGRVASAGSQL